MGRPWPFIWQSPLFGSETTADLALRTADGELVAHAPADPAWALDRIAQLEVEKAVMGAALARSISETLPGGVTVTNINVRAGVA